MQQGGYLWNKTAITAESVPDDETLGEFGAVRNVNRRERKLEESFQEGLEGTTIVAPRLHYVYSESNLGEKNVLGFTVLWKMPNLWETNFPQQWKAIL